LELLIQLLIVFLGRLSPYIRQVVCLSFKPTLLLKLFQLLLYLRRQKLDLPLLLLLTPRYALPFGQSCGLRCPTLKELIVAWMAFTAFALTMSSYCFSFSSSYLSFSSCTFIQAHSLYLDGLLLLLVRCKFTLLYDFILQCHLSNVIFVSIHT